MDLDDNAWQEWTWEEDAGNQQVALSDINRTVTLNPRYSNGTTAVKGNKPLDRHMHHYWEIEFTEPHGSHVGMGVVTDEVDLKAYSGSSEYVNLIGTGLYAFQGWGVTASGVYHHGNVSSPAYKLKILPGDRIGMYLDRWNCRLEFFHNGRPLGPVFTGDNDSTKFHFQESILYPAVYSSANGTTFRLLCAKSFPHSLQLETLLSVRESVKLKAGEWMPMSAALTTKFQSVPPGLLTAVEKSYWWLNVGHIKRKKPGKRGSPFRTPTVPARSSPRLNKQMKREDLFSSFPQTDFVSVFSTGTV